MQINEPCSHTRLHMAHFFANHACTHTQREMRQHVVRFLLETEQSYVQSLRTIVKVN